MSGYKRNQEIFQTSNSNDNVNNLIATISSGAQQTKRQRTENNDKDSICWKYFEPFKVPKENGTVTKCKIPGCTTSYIWCGSTSNHVRHLKNKHGIMKFSTPLTPTTSTINFNNTELEINLPLIKFIVSSGAPLRVVDTLKSAGFVNPNIELSTSDIIEEQINKAYNRLFLQLKLKAQQEKYTMLSICEIKPDTRVNECDDYSGDYSDDYNDDNVEFFDSNLWEEEYQHLTQNLIQMHDIKNNYFSNLENLIEYSLNKWARENVNIQEISEIIKVIIIATGNLCGVVKFLKEHITCSYREIPTKEYINLLDRIAINADNILREIQFNDDLEHKVLKSFLTSIPLCFEDRFLFDKCLASFLDPRSKPDEVSPVILKDALKKCQAYYLNNIFSDNLDKSMQAANEELKCYNSDVNPYEWWQGSKQMLPGLATLARDICLY
ncbi:25658_t:CDS:2 [Racocetra persica]|uniref:25658_t:CDS:1 n=1 Tax=Racocetra persica TaxID=160502 RepID=A0ACA9N4I5_9GLOM|nr:25658_t:CDS:2 [Racocetra persica]